MNKNLSRPRLRPEVSIVPFSSSTKEGTYLILLGNGRSLQATERLYELLCLLDGSRKVEEIARTLSGKWRCLVRPEEVEGWLFRYVEPYDLLEPASERCETHRVRASKAASATGRMLIPARLLVPLTQRLRILFHPLLAVPFLLTATACHVLLYMEMPWGFPSTLSHPSTSVYLAGYMFVLISVLCHEVGHLTACQYFECPHGEIRIGLYLVFPVMYANVDYAWRLDRKARIVVDLGGVYFQVILTIPAFLLFHVTGGALWSLLFFELDTMILFCLNPFLRFDGYWLCSDLLGIPNLRSRARLLIKALAGRLTRRTEVSPNPLLEVRRWARLGLFLYTTGTYAFGMFVFVLFLLHVAPRIPTIPATTLSLTKGIVYSAHQGDLSGACAQLMQMLLLLVMILGAGRMLGRASRSAARALHQVLRQA